MLAGLIAERLEIDVILARRAGLLHDISKALSYEVGTDSAQASGALARKCGENVAVIEVIETHNLELLVRSVIAITVKTADEISNSRPGAHKEKVEEYVTRMQNIEEIAGSYPGVRSAFAVQNGKEVRVMIDSASVNDTNANQLADEITESLEEDLDQPGQIKVCVIRELRAVRLCIHRTPRHMYAQLIAAEGDRVLASASTLDKDLRGTATGNVAAAAGVGKLIADRAKAAGVTKVAFDRSGFRFHGRVKALADAAREGGLEF